MAKMPKIAGADKLKSKLTAKARLAKKGSVTVGYTANYAIYVHEMVGANFQRPGSQAKFLEQPLREMRPQLTAMVKRAHLMGATILHSLYLAGLALQRRSQELCPLDTGNLRASAYTRKD